MLRGSWMELSNSSVTAPANLSELGGLGSDRPTDESIPTYCLCSTPKSSWLASRWVLPMLVT